MSPGYKCEDNKNYTITYEMTCFKQDDFLYKITNEKDIDLNNCENIIKVQTTEACPKINYYIVSAFIDEYNSFMGAVVIILGIFLIFLGAKFLKVTILIVGTISSITILFLFYFNIFSPENEKTVWILLGIGAIMGLTLGYLMIKFTKGVTMLIGGYLGYLVSIFVYNMMLKYIHSNPHIVYWVNTIGCIFLFALLSLWIAKITLIVSTSVMGGYAVVKGVSFYIGYFPSESVIRDLIKYEEYDELKEVILYYS
jgi:hypothetical protein